MEEGIIKANNENDALFDQIDQMDLLIQAEEEKYITENLTIGSWPNKIKFRFMLLLKIEIG